MSEIKTLARAFKMIEKLRQRRYSLNEIVEFLKDENTDTAPAARTVENYISILRKLKFNIELKDTRYFLNEPEKHHTNDFKPFEMKTLHDLVSQYLPDDFLKTGLLQKLLVEHPISAALDVIIKHGYAENVAKLDKAIEQKKQVLLKNYQSMNSNKLSDRLVEPKSFVKNYEKIDCFDVNDNKIKTFNLERIGSVEMTVNNQTHTAAQKEFKDVFGTSSFESRVVRLRMSKRAKLIMEKEFPITQALIKDDGGNKYFIQTQYARVESIGRFILGLPGEIEVLSDEYLKNYLKQQKEK